MYVAITFHPIKTLLIVNQAYLLVKLETARSNWQNWLKNFVYGRHFIIFKGVYSWLFQCLVSQTWWIARSGVLLCVVRRDEAYSWCTLYISHSLWRDKICKRTKFVTNSLWSGDHLCEPTIRIQINFIWNQKTMNTRKLPGVVKI